MGLHYKMITNQQWFIGAKVPNELCRGKTSWQSQQAFIPTTAPSKYN
ncbi:hypothetical protein STRCR_1857 [Streptococcus criceti HS-6]|uniref:Uncharacterized protein n=1 Tax=Streptococcus criceti HS-6 TaxID=873449 RepID=G5JQQ3_STRCG|nr:hypothetical protein [Streptococcus sp. ZJ1593]EHI75055.1 hypothetical protein STRCR_1857 [Streptococcus criceti HS-6]